MKKFKFRLQKVLEHKERLFDIAKEEYLIQVRALQELQAELERLKKAFTRCLVQAGDFTKQQFRIKDLALFYRYQFFLKREMRECAARISKQENVVSQKRAALVAAAQEKEVLVKLKARRFKEYQYEVDTEEQKTMDDIFSAKFIRNQTETVVGA